MYEGSLPKLPDKKKTNAAFFACKEANLVFFLDEKPIIAFGNGFLSALPGLFMLRRLLRRALGCFATG